MIVARLDASDLVRTGGRFIGALIGESRAALDAQANEANRRLGVGFWNNNTGRTKKSFVVRMPNALHAVLESDSLVALYLDVGTKAHEIRARQAGALAFYWAAKARFFLGGRVEHPGTQATHYIGREAQRSAPELAKRGEQGAEAAARKVGLD